MGKPHERLDAWKVSMDLVKAVYDTTATFPREERYGLAQQMRRAAVSIPSNIAEGSTRMHPKEYLQFLSISRGSLASLAELETQLQLAGMLGFAPADCSAFALAERTGRLRTGMHKRWSKI